MPLKCPGIGQIKFSQTSLDAINEIRNRQILSNVLLVSMGAGTVFSIFTPGSSLLETSCSLYSTDFKTMAEAMASVPPRTREIISKIAFKAQYDAKDYKVRQMWEAVRYGRRIYR